MKMLKIDFSTLWQLPCISIIIILFIYIFVACDDAHTYIHVPAMYVYMIITMYVVAVLILW